MALGYAPVVWSFVIRWQVQDKWAVGFGGVAGASLQLKFPAVNSTYRTAIA
jgi:hypothetical protein